MAEGEEDLPRDAKIMKSLIKSMGVEEHEPRVVHQFLELWYRYAVDVLTDAHVYSEHAGKASIDCDDVKLAIQSKVNFSFSQPPPRERRSRTETAAQQTAEQQVSLNTQQHISQQSSHQHKTASLNRSKTNHPAILNRAETQPQKQNSHNHQCRNTATTSRAATSTRPG
ncbi:transcription initiation factor TFIID subunit 9-like [Chenopodium quinoa]|uniref:transcription initiation factor TFIID subunit 9-like n=1 Tax=Chenopodium quinoa TaxID=63459 RepID=UPI000B76FA8C|nr:transcription initiation factor TFIID subunit 9-like [Chenopodium quinoa]